MPVSQYRNKMAIFEKIAWDTFSLHTSHILICISDERYIPEVEMKTIEGLLQATPKKWLQRLASRDTSILQAPSVEIVD